MTVTPYTLPHCGELFQDESYDLMGNRTAVQSWANGLPTAGGTYNYNPANQLTTTPGSVNGWIDGTQQPALTGFDNSARRIDRARLGAIAGVDTTTNGALYFDAFESRRSAYIGPSAERRAKPPSCHKQEGGLLFRRGRRQPRRLNQPSALPLCPSPFLSFRVYLPLSIHAGLGTISFGTEG